MAETAFQKTILDEKTMEEIRRVIRRTIHEEFALLRIASIAPVDDEEQNELENLIGDVEELKKGEYEDADGWLEDKD